jgi:hypothetical protein
MGDVAGDTPRSGLAAVIEFEPEQTARDLGLPVSARV